MTATESTRGSKRFLVAGGSLLAVAGMLTAAAFTDFANLNLGGDSGIGGDNTRFNIQVVGTDPETNEPIPGTWQEANTAEGVAIAVPGADLITPGDTVSVEIPFRNESPALGADLAFTLQDRAGFVSDAEFAQAVRYTIALDGTEIVANATQEAVADLDLGVYAAGEEGVLSVSITLPDQGSVEANNALQGKTTYVQAHFDASSVQP
ncbi:hypothetical protein [Microbacterium thalli]|uniref:SipW-cognate class signal peptide n=1 Tax=Microbacterium thalli TaxID=3027921 RepID=A0ABT5SDP7_9MICO|nr:hypothetical protein [Microbacterium thalli]MDD7928343.1 hypothetical protein [Microbacterium thalli]MDD7960926.1 hypothetical protein [Microbacterium thalli]MDN8548844.1 hypothetical protein [Microbacterium thalli]